MFVVRDGGIVGTSQKRRYRTPRRMFRNVPLGSFCVLRPFHLANPHALGGEPHVPDCSIGFVLRFLLSAAWPLQWPWFAANVPDCSIGFVLHISFCVSSSSLLWILRHRVPIFPGALRFCDDKSAARASVCADFRGKAQILNFKS